MRAADGHPAPFTINYVEVGNEDFFDGSGSYSNYRWPMFYDAIHAAFPNIRLIATTGVSSSDPQPYAYDDHYYHSPTWFDQNAGLYSGTSRSGPKVLVGEWASEEGTPTPDLNSAVGDASWLTGLIQNSDVVMGESYAPGLVNVNNVAWGTNLIGFNALTSYVSPSYWVQEMLAQNHGDEVIASAKVGYQGVNEVATEDSTTHEVYITLTNPAASAEAVNVDLSGIGALSSLGRAIVLSGTSGTATNTIDDPNAISPQTSLVSGLTSQFTWTLPAHSVTVLDLNLPQPSSSGTRALYRCSRLGHRHRMHVVCHKVRKRSGRGHHRPGTRHERRWARS
jgi:alpha-L-arabinofuranosidase